MTAVKRTRFQPDGDIGKERKVKRNMARTELALNTA